MKATTTGDTPEGRRLAVDVLVCGGGMAGTLAAVAAGRAGARTLLVERWGFLGGSATAAAVGQFVGWETDTGRRVVAGLAEEVVERLVARGASSGHGHFTMSTGHRMDRVAYDPEILKVVLDEMAVSAPLRILFHVVVQSVSTSPGRIDSVTLLSKSGPITVAAAMVIDATGDLDVMARSGARMLPLESGEALQPATMMFRYGPIDQTRFAAILPTELKALAARGVESGALARAALHQAPVPGTDDGWFNVSRVPVDATDPFALSAAEIEGRRQAVAAADFLRREVPGCERGRLVGFAAQLGIRETRRVLGGHVLSADELRRGERFWDTIAMGAYPIDIHPNQGGGLRFETLGTDHHYEIPLRCLVPAGLDNALVAGRGISATHEANAAARVMSMAMALGQAAGTAAALVCAQGETSVHAVAVDAIRTALGAAGAKLA